MTCVSYKFLFYSMLISVECVLYFLLLIHPVDDETGACTSLEEMMKGGELGMDKKFASLSEVVSEKTLNAVTDMGFTDMMGIQHKSIRPESMCILYVLCQFKYYETHTCMYACTCTYTQTCTRTHEAGKGVGIRSPTWIFTDCVRCILLRFASPVNTRYTVETL